MKTWPGIWWRSLLVVLPADVQEARGGAEGIKYAREHHVDLIILDLVMNDASGFDVISELKADRATRDIPVVMHTSLTIGDTERQALSHARAIVSKARTEPELRDIVRTLVTGIR